MSTRVRGAHCDGRTAQGFGFSGFLGVGIRVLRRLGFIGFSVFFGILGLEFYVGV